MRSFAGASEPTREELREAPLRWPRPSRLDHALTTLSGVGPRLAEAAAEAGIATVGDLLWRFPHSHRDRTVEPLAEVEPGRQATVLVEVLGAAPSTFRRRGLSIVSVRVGDESGAVRASWFNQPWVAQKLTRETQLLLTGSKDRRGFRVSEYEILSSGGGEGPPRAGGTELIPVHPATAQL
ncbi:MAG TPA: hypothetical protein VF770_05070, partial [Solirubrobacterales bacterium]